MNNLFKISLLISCLAVGFFVYKNYYTNHKLIPPMGMSFVSGNDVIKDFFIDKTPVTVAQFRIFVNSTKYITEAERFGDAGVFDFETGQWSLKQGANWQYPEGFGTKKTPDNHPVTQVSWNDAQAYCNWAKKRLPSKLEFDHAANSSDKEVKTYAWGESAIENGNYKANFWQGSFPNYNTKQDGFLTTSPVGFFGKNKLKLSDMGGNVWQWLSDWHIDKTNEKMQSGGSFLCDPTVCHGFKIGGVSSSTPESSLMHVGFRCIKDI